MVEGVRLRKVLMDGGSGLNIMYADTLKGMGIAMSKLSERTRWWKESDCAKSSWMAAAA